MAYKLEVAMPRPALVKVEEVSKIKNDVCINKAIKICSSPIKTSNSIRDYFPLKENINAWKNLNNPEYTSVECYNKVYNCCKKSLKQSL